MRKKPTQQINKWANQQMRKWENEHVNRSIRQYVGTSERQNVRTSERSVGASERRVCLLSCLFLLQSNHSTEQCRRTVENLNDKFYWSIVALFRSRVWRTQKFTKSPREQWLWRARMDAGVSPSFFFQQISRRTLFDPNVTGSNHSLFGVEIRVDVRTFGVTNCHRQTPPT